MLVLSTADVPFSTPTNSSQGSNFIRVFAIAESCSGFLDSCHLNGCGVEEVLFKQTIFTAV